ncbi:MAG: hypothetical protein H7145_24100 [Akkermansiaceae bacterium]|nr:hypothetical protein [Armatimonadota bacterium]
MPVFIDRLTDKNTLPRPNIEAHYHQMCACGERTQAEAELQQAKMLYCAALEQHSLVQQILTHSRLVYRRAQENLECLAMKEGEKI